MNKISKNIKLFLFLALCVSIIKPAQSSEMYTYNALSQAVAGYVHNEIMRSIISKNCSITEPKLDVDNNEKIVKWAIRLYPPKDRKKAGTALSSVLYEFKMQIYAQGRNIFSGFFYRSESEKLQICNELIRTLKEGERDNIKKINLYKYVAK